MLTVRRGGADTSGSPEGSGLPKVSFEVFIELSILSGLLRRGLGVEPGQSVLGLATAVTGLAVPELIRSVAEIGH
jgi:hypothetical protein